MEIYLPIAEQSMNVFVLLALGGAAGLLAGMFGVGGGFLATPLLIFVGIPPAVAVASQANQVVANSISSLQVQWRRGAVDLLGFPKGALVNAVIRYVKKQIPAWKIDGAVRIRQILADQRLALLDSHAGRAQHAARAVREQHAQVAVALT